MASVTAAALAGCGVPASWAAPQRAGLLNAAGLAALIAAKSGGPKARVCPQFGAAMMAKLRAGPLSGKKDSRQDAVHHETANVDSDDLYPVFVSAVAANYDSGFAGMPPLTDLVEAMRPVEESYAGS